MSIVKVIKNKKRFDICNIKKGNCVIFKHYEKIHKVSWHFIELCKIKEISKTKIIIESISNKKIFKIKIDKYLKNINYMNLKKI